MKPLISYIITTCNRREELTDAIDSILFQDYSPYEIIILDNGSTDGTESLFSSNGLFNQDEIRYYKFNKKLGVSRARNEAFDRAEGEYIITVDDDAIICESSSISSVVELFENEDDLGAVAFQLRNYYSDEIEFPYTREFGVIPSRVNIPLNGHNGRPIETTFFPGGACGIRSSAVEDDHLYPKEFAYGAEEIDLALRLLDSGFFIKYHPSVLYRHKWSNNNRRMSKRLLVEGYENRVRVALRNLPWRYVLLTLVIRGVATITRTRDLRAILKAIRNIVNDRETILDNRSVIDLKTIDYIKSRSGLIW